MQRIFAILVSLGCVFMAGCTPDYGIVAPDPVYIEVPVYIEEEVPEDPGLVWVDSVTQIASTKGTDILWIIDTSCSMDDDASRVLSGIEAMINSLPTSGWRLNMLSADPAGYTDQQFPLVPGDTIVEAEIMYGQMSRGGVENGFEAVQKYIEESTYAPTWMRDDASLLIVFVSDEEEQSTAVFYTVSSFTSWLDDIRTGIFVSSIVNLEQSESLCYAHPSSEGIRFAEVTNYYGGVIVDICSEDWSPGVRDASAQLEPHDSIKLSHEPVEDSVRVFVDGDIYNDWYYDSADNTVYFVVVPDSGSLMEVGYRYHPLDTGNS